MNQAATISAAVPADVKAEAAAAAAALMTRARAAR